MKLQQQSNKIIGKKVEEQSEEEMFELDTQDVYMADLQSTNIKDLKFFDFGSK